MRTDDLRRGLTELASEQPAAGATDRVIAAGKRRLRWRRFAVGAVTLAVIGASVGVAAASRDDHRRGVVVGPPPTTVDRPLPAPRAASAPQVIFTSESEGWVCGDPLLHTADGGDHWQAQSWSNLATGTATCAAVPTDAWVVVQSPAGDVTVLPAQGGAHIAVTVDFPKVPVGATVAQATFVDKNTGWVLVRPSDGADGHGLLYRTTTGSGPIDFTLVSSAAPIGHVQFVSATEGWGTDGRTLEHTTDGGTTWNAVSVPTPPRYAQELGVFFDDLWARGSTIVVVGNNPSGSLSNPFFVVSTDSGTTWTERNGPSAPLGTTAPLLFDAVDGTHWWSYFGNRLWATEDGGQTWTEMIPAPPNALSISFPTARSNWATDAKGRVYRWFDGGAPWERVDTTPLPPWQTNLVSVPADPGGCPKIDALGVHSSPDQAARDFVRATRGWTDETLVASYPVTQPGGQFGPVFAANVPRQCGRAVADASYAVELTNPSVTQDSSRSTALVVAPIDGAWKVWGFYR